MSDDEKRPMGPPRLDRGPDSLEKLNARHRELWGLGERRSSYLTPREIVAIERGRAMLERDRENHEKTKPARDEKAKKAKSWNSVADRLAAEKWAANSHLRAGKVARLIHSAVRAECPNCPEDPDTVRKHIAPLDPKKKVGSSVLKSGFRALIRKYNLFKDL